MEDFAELHGLTHRQVAARLVLEGWSVCGVGDWATVWRSPDGLLAARVSPFELAYAVFVELCRNLTGHTLVPRIDFDAPLAGGGRVTVMEFLVPSEGTEAEAITERWEAARADDPVGAVRSEAERLSEKASSAIPYWGGIDLNSDNIMIDVSGNPKLVDLFYCPGHAVFGALRHRPEEFAAQIPADRCRYITEIGCAARVWTPEQIAVYREAVETLS